ncbi:MAG: hypothetical protein E7157_04570 [Lactobacillales bacterium]|nr:hypothetical protein [Lactobacillales bacterium]
MLSNKCYNYCALCWVVKVMLIKKIVVYGGLITTLAAGLKIYNENKHYNHFIKEIERHETSNFHDSEIVAHRGFSSLYVENSMEAVTNAFDSCCVDEVEIDIRLTKDKEIVLMHNKLINLNCNGSGFVENKTLEELKEYRYRNSDFIMPNEDYPDKTLIENRNEQNLRNVSQIITLEELLNNALYDKTLIIDVKINNNIDDMVLELSDILSSYDGNLNIRIQSTNEEFLQKMKLLHPNYGYQIVISKKKHLSYINSNYDAIVIKYSLITDEIVEQCIKDNKEVYVWTINTYEQYEEVREELDETIDYVKIVSDSPDVMCYLNNCSDKQLKKLKEKK